jgi:hypothetical protein
MKKFLLTVFAVLGLTAVASASVAAPKDSNGQTLPTMDFVGADTCRVTASDSTNGKLCFTGKGFVYGVSVSSDAATNYALFRDSATANTSSTVSMVIWNDTTEADEGGTLTTVIALPAPAKFTNGLSVNLNAALPGTGTGSEWVIFYRKQSATE